MCEYPNYFKNAIFNLRNWKSARDVVLWIYKLADPPSKFFISSENNLRVEGNCRLVTGGLGFGKIYVIRFFFCRVLFEVNTARSRAIFPHEFRRKNYPWMLAALAHTQRNVERRYLISRNGDITVRGCILGAQLSVWVAGVTDSPVCRSLKLEIF